jgi:mitochondrial fission protein ELM1
VADPRWALLLADGKPGHENQSLGVLPEGVDPWRFQVVYRSRAARLRAWLAARWPIPCGALAGGFPWRGVLRDADGLAAQVAEAGPPALVLSAGSGPAPVTLLAARHLRRPAVTCMTPSVGLSGFDLGLVPRHDRPPQDPRIVVTLGAPNRIDPAALAAAGEALKARHGLGAGPFIALLVGGDSARHRIPPELGAAIQAAALDLAASRKAALLVTTSRRTRVETEDRMGLRADETAWFCRGRTDPEPAVPGMLGLAELVIVTEDSVSMVSEAASAPARVLTVAVEAPGGPPRRHEAVLAALAEGGYIRRTDAGGIVAAGQALLDAPPPPVLDDTGRCREAVARLVAHPEIS